MMVQVPPLPSRLRKPPKSGKIGDNGKEICVRPNELKAGDVLLSMGTANHSDWIRFLDGGSYSHASYFDGEKLVELSEIGVIEMDPSDRVLGQVYTDVYRYRPPETGLTAGQAKAVTEAIRRYMGHPLATHDLVLSALLVVSRKVDLPGSLEDRLRVILELAMKALRKLIYREQREHLICSELIYRGFWEARKPGPIEFLIFPQYPQSLFRVPQVLAESPSPRSPFSFRPQRRTTKLMAEFAELYLAHKLGRHHPMGAPELAAIPDLSGESLRAFLANDPVADYVSPRDLEESQSLIELGRACKEDY